MATPEGTPSPGLCRVVEIRRVGMVPYWVSSRGYVVSDADCNEAFCWDPLVPVPVPASVLKAEGRLPQAVPDAPPFSFPERVRGHLGLLLLAAFCLASAGVVLGRWRMRLVRMEILGLRDDPVFRLLDQMRHAAALSMPPDPDAVAHIRDLGRELTGLDYTSAHVEAAIERTEPLRIPGDFHRFGVGLTPCQKTMLLEGALSIVMADGRLREVEARFCTDMISGLGLARPEA